MKTGIILKLCDPLRKTGQSKQEVEGLKLEVNPKSYVTFFRFFPETRMTFAEFSSWVVFLGLSCRFCQDYKPQGLFSKSAVEK
ncbi:MAG TPA: hypothetical protein DD706_14410 [Nitrospiraceae bacterium]|nr:hypothetical protein [Nitrospiraceae bacterium]